MTYILAFKFGPKARTYIIALLLVPFLVGWSIRAVAWIPILGEGGLLSYIFIIT